ncbi:3-phosphoshikimate 1-carboxyvinyltransferase [candidate division KSB1 bacterium]|nr:3-phosphoshikimate 1-carboxyvinyltransferase [candidate division KSB1 bacterium]
MIQTIQKARKLSGRVNLPGDKSISHRALMLGALAEGDTPIANLSYGQDVLNTRLCLKALGVRMEGTSLGLLVHGVGMSGLKRPESRLNCGNSGTTMRLLSGILSAQSFESWLSGDASLNSRPMGRILDPLSKMQAHIMAQPEGTAPLRIQGSPLSPIHYDSLIASAQVKSCVLLAGLFANGRTSVTEPKLSRDHTERMLPCFGVPVERDGLTVTFQGPAKLKACPVRVPGDISSAAFFLVAGSLVPDSEIYIENVGLNPTRAGIIDVLERMGAQIEVQNYHEQNGEPSADLIIRSAPLHATVIEKNEIPRLIDELPILAIAATQAEGRTIVHDARELRVKESDRITVIEKGLKEMGVQITTFEDGFEIEGPQSLCGAQIETCHDHRIAMAFAVAGLIATGSTEILDAENAETSHPGFFHTIKELTHDE